MSYILGQNIAAWWDEAEYAASPKVSPNGDVTLHVNHPDCPAGEDRKRRLYITEEAATGTRVAYCHNCGNSGVSRSEISVAHVNKSLGLRPTEGTGPRKVTPLTDFNALPTLEHCGGLVRAHFIAIFGITAELDHFDPAFKTDPDGMGFYLPVYSKNMRVIAYQHRNLGPTPRSVKYLTYYTDAYEISDGVLRSWYTWLEGPEDRTLCIVEDVLSAYKIWSAQRGCTGMDVDVLVLLGSHLSNSEILSISKEYPKVVVWLDNDSPTVDAESKRIRDTFGMLGTKATRIKHLKDPKHEPTTTIRVEIEHAIARAIP